MTSKGIRAGALSLLILLIAVSGVPAQTDWFRKSGREQGKNVRLGSLFMYETFAVPVPDTQDVHLILFTKVAYDLLQFVRQDSVFKAQYELTLAVKNEMDETVAGKIQNKTLKTLHYSVTNSRSRFSETRFDLSLAPGEYTLFLELLDKETDSPHRYVDKVRIPDYFNAPLTATDLLFFHTPEHEIPSVRKHFPAIPPIRSQSDTSFFAKFFIAGADTLSRVRIDYKILDHQSTPILTDSSYLQREERIQPVNILINQDLTFGQYTFQITVSTDMERIERSKILYIRWGTHPSIMPSIERAVDMLQYIMPRSEWRTLKDLPPKEQEQQLENFWKERDPTPDTRENELEDEFYSRIAFANQYFSLWKDAVDGWMTDRGKVYIIYGAPSNVERPYSPTGERGRYEIWYYSHLQKRFVFLDRYDSEDYRLISEE
jgi:GWxTD domain-containing protein